MSLATFFGFNLISSTNSELPEIFKLRMSLLDFVETDIFTIYSKILTDCAERTQGIPEEITPLLWDNCLQNESTYGLVTLLAYAMANKTELFLVYNPALKVLRKATEDEARQIKQDYKLRGTSKTGVYVSFQNYKRTDMIKLYSEMEYCVIYSLNKLANLSKSIQFKMSDMRKGVGLNDQEVAINQAKAIAKALGNGQDVMMDALDIIATATPDITATKESIVFLDSKRAFYYNMPISYINGEQTPGIGSTGEADTKAIERGLKQYYISDFKPVVEAVFRIQTSFKSNDFRQINSALEALKTFDLVSDDLISMDNKKIVVSRLLDIENDQVNRKNDRSQA